MEREPRYADHLEEWIGVALQQAGINFIHESQQKNIGLDFYLPEYDLYLEIKQFHTDSVFRQMSSRNNVIAIQGRPSVEFFIKMLGLNKCLRTPISSTTIKP